MFVPVTKLLVCGLEKCPPIDISEHGGVHVDRLRSEERAGVADARGSAAPAARAPASGALRNARGLAALTAAAPAADAGGENADLVLHAAQLGARLGAHDIVAGALRTVARPSQIEVVFNGQRQGVGQR